MSAEHQAWARPTTDLPRWLGIQARREASALRLEDALLGDRFAAYFTFRLRYFAVRVVFATAIHVVKITLLFAAFAREEFLLVIALGAAATIANDFWWGALERMRQRIRQFHHDGAAHKVSREIERWLRFAAIISLVLVALGAVWMGLLLAQGHGLGPTDAYALALVGGTAAGLVVRVYHSGAYALRRIYRPLASLLAADLFAVACLLLLWPVLGLWALPISEGLAIAVVLATAVHYTTRTYRVLGFPAMGTFVRSLLPLPTRNVLRSAIAPGLANALVGIEALVLVLLLASPGSGDFLIVLVAAASPVIRAGIEWAQLLYFDLARLEVPLLQRMRRRLDAAILCLAFVIGVVTWGVAAALSAGVLGVDDIELLFALLFFLVVRSLLASAQVRAFTAGRYLRLSIFGIIVGLGSWTALLLTSSDPERLVALGVALVLPFVGLLALGAKGDPIDDVLTLPDWLARLRHVPGPVTVTELAFDARSQARGVTIEERQTEEWRRRLVAKQIGGRAGRVGGAAAWHGPCDLVCFGCPDEAMAISRMGGGLIVRPPRATSFATGAAAAQSVCSSLLGEGVVDPEVIDQQAAVAEFKRSFQRGLVFQADRRAPAELIAMNSRLRAEVLRAALRFLRDPTQASTLTRWEITALAYDGGLAVIFLVDRREPAKKRRRWARRVHYSVLARAAMGEG